VPADPPATDSARHALVVGGSGMLAGLCRALADERWQVSVVGRDRDKLARVGWGEPRIHPISVDYRHIHAFAVEIARATSSRGGISLAVCWIRSWAPKSLLTAARAVSPGGRLVHVPGSQRTEPLDVAVAALRRRAGLRYCQVQLGALVEGGVPRWLTHDEICAGVYRAIAAEQPFSRVGTAFPRSDGDALSATVEPQDPRV
jgi:hypothetical protein